MADSYIEITEKDFTEKVLNAPNMVIVHFSKENSRACIIQEPEFEAVSKDYQDRITFARIYVTGNEQILKQWNITGVPSILFFKGGNEIYRVSGIVMRQRLKRQVEGILLAN